MTNHKVKSVVVFGGGLAGVLCVQAILKNLPTSLNVIWIEPEETSLTDIFYGTVAPPSFYGLFLKLGISEPDILLNTNSSLSYGTHYKNWGLTDRNWIQSYSKSLPIIDGVGFHHLVQRFNQSTLGTPKLEPYLMSSVAASNGRFAHPPDDLNSPLSSAEYGFNFNPSDWSRFLLPLNKSLEFQHIKSDIEDVEREHATITSVKLKNGKTIKANFYIDCRAHSETTLPLNADNWVSRNCLKAEMWTETPNQSLHGTRILISEKDGWISQTPLQRATQFLKISAVDENEEEPSPPSERQSSIEKATLGSRTSAWVGNCLSLGHAAAMIEPLTPAPLMLLQADIERLLELFPISRNMAVEQREYNRRFNDDLMHLSIFQQSFFQLSDLPETDYWRESASERVNEKLSVKIDQFQNRGVAVRYDYEPFEEQDWLTLHYGLGRIPKRHDSLADRMEFKKLESILTDMRMAISQITKKMPPHPTYMERFLEYLRKRYV